MCGNKERSGCCKTDLTLPFDNKTSLTDTLKGFHLKELLASGANLIAASTDSIKDSNLVNAGRASLKLAMGPFMQEVSGSLIAKEKSSTSVECKSVRTRRTESPEIDRTACCDVNQH